MLDIEQIKAIIPHRYPFLLIDRILELEEGKRAVGLKNVTANEEFLPGAFPSTSCYAGRAYCGSSRPGGSRGYSQHGSKQR